MKAELEIKDFLKSINEFRTPDSADALARLGADSDYPNSVGGVEEKGRSCHNA